MSLPMTRRDFLAATATAVAAAPALGRDARPAEPTGVVYGRTGPEGFRTGSADRPSLGSVTLLDGRTLMAAHATSWRIAPRKGVLLAPDGAGGWSILYAEV